MAGQVGQFHRSVPVRLQGGQGRRLFGRLGQQGFHGGKPVPVAGLDPFRHQDLLESIPENRRRHLGSVEGSLGRIQHDDHGISGGITGHKAHKGGNVHPGDIAAFGRQFFCGPGLAGDLVALDLGRFAAPFGNHLFHHGPHFFRHFRRDHRADHFCFPFLEDFSIRACDFFDNIRFYQAPTVGNGANGTEHLERSHSNPLSDGHGGHIGRHHILGVVQDPRFFPGHITAGGAAEAEGFGILGFPFASQLQAQVGHPRIQGEFDHVSKGHMAHALAVPVPDPPASHVDGPLVVEGRIGGDDPFHQPGGPHNGFEHGSGFIDDAHAPVHIGSFGGLGKMVGIEGGPAGHPQDLPGVGVHQDGSRTGRMGLFDGFIQALFQDELHPGVNGELDRVHPPYLDLVHGTLAHLVALGVEEAAFFLVPALQLVVHGGFHPLQPLVIGAHKAQDLGRQVVFRIEPFAFFLEMEPAELLFLQDGFHLVRHMGIQGPLHPDEPPVRLTEFFVQFVRIQSQHRCQGIRCHLFGVPAGHFPRRPPVRIVHQFLGIHIEGFADDAYRQLLPVPVHDAAPGGDFRMFPGDLVIGLLGQGTALDDLEPEQPDHNDQHGQPQEFPQAHGPELSLMEDFLVIGIQLQHRFFRCRTRFFLFSLQKLRYLHRVHLPVSFRPGWNGLLPEGGTRDPAGCFPRSISIRYTESTRPMPTRVMIREVPP